MQSFILGNEIERRLVTSTYATKIRKGRVYSKMYISVNKTMLVKNKMKKLVSSYLFFTFY